MKRKKRITSAVLAQFVEDQVQAQAMATMRADRMLAASLPERFTADEACAALPCYTRKTLLQRISELECAGMVEKIGWLSVAGGRSAIWRKVASDD
jgi:hypothetical protein